MLRSAVLLALAAILAAADPTPGCQAALAGVPAGGQAGVAVWDCRAKAWAFRSGADRPMRLASTTKLLVAAAALAELGRDFQFTTRVFALGPVSGGTVPGIGVIGGGDPTFDEHLAPGGDPEAILKDWAERIRAAGISRVAGDLLVDPRLFGGPIRPLTYPGGHANLVQWFSAPASAFAFNDNCIDVRAVPTRPGQPCLIQTRPRSPRIAIVNRTATAAGRGDGRFAVDRDDESNQLTVSGSYDRTTAWFPVSIQRDPDLLAGDAFRAALTDAGVQVAGTVKLGPVDPALGPRLVEHRSQLLPALGVMNHRSQNFYGEQILRLVGRKAGGDGTVLAGAAAVRESLLRLAGRPAAAIELVDGSGLSYANRAPAEAMCTVLAAIDRHRIRDDLIESLKDKPVAGITGRVKTGTLATASSLVGWVDGPNGRFAFAILLDQGDARAWGWGAGVREKVYAAIAAAAR
jgi:PBP4 family serine-type D-alanyl-D-alanine carboxypeptidase